MQPASSCTQGSADTCRAYRQVGLTGQALYIMLHDSAVCQHQCLHMPTILSFQIKPRCSAPCRGCLESCLIAQAQRILRKKELQNSRRNANAVGVSDRATVTVNELKKLFPALGKQLIQSKLVTECGCENIKASCRQPI